MTYMFAGLAGLAGGALGWALFALVAHFAAGRLGVSDVDGGRAMGAFWGIGPIGGLIGLILGLVLVLRYQGGFTGFGEIAWRGGAVVAGLGAIAAAGVFIRMQTLPELGMNGPKPQLQFEIRVPAALALPESHALRIELHTDKASPYTALMRSEPPRLEGESKVVAGLIDLYHRTSNRTLMFNLPDGRQVAFRLAIRATPRHGEALGPWEPAAHLFDPGAETGRAPRPGEDFAIRYRVDWEFGK